ncbi:MAG TPA: type II toxin-antitoxin system RelE/ParE family toxin [Thermoanaerobaculia bacterium]|nr:type II toxin-antitoxin system RelE/ParE family toxin [Thermoanaerobaculia bacterium]
MKYRIIVRRLAERDLEDAEDWYNGQQSGLGIEFRDTIGDLFGRLAENPRIYPRVYGEVHRAVLRRFPYLVYFVIEHSDVIVLAVLDGRRDPRIHRQRSGA